MCGKTSLMHHSVRENKPVAPFQVPEKNPISPFHGQEKHINGLLVIYGWIEVLKK